MSNRMNDTCCFVYIMKANVRMVRNGLNDDVLKVGISHNPKGRLATFATACPHSIELANQWRLPTRDVAFQIEQAVHGIYTEKRLAGEWFHHFLPDMQFCVEAAIFSWLMTYPKLNEQNIMLLLHHIGVSRENSEEFIFETYFAEAS